MVVLFFHLASKWPKWCAQTLHPFSQILKIFPRIGAPIVAPPNDNFQICSIHWKAILIREKMLQTHLNWPTNTNALSSWITQLRHLWPLSVWALFTNIQSENITFVLSRRRALFDFHHILHDDRGPSCHHCTTLDPPLRRHYIGKIPNFLSFWGRKPTPLSRSRWSLAASIGLPARFHLDRCSAYPCGAKNRKIGTWVKTIRADISCRWWRSPCVMTAMTMHWSWLDLRAGGIIEAESGGV